MWNVLRRYREACVVADNHRTALMVCRVLFMSYPFGAI